MVSLKGIDPHAEVPDAVLRLYVRMFAVSELLMVAYLFSSDPPLVRLHEPIVRQAVPDVTSFVPPLPDTIYVLYSPCADDKARSYSPPSGRALLDRHGNATDARVFAPACGDRPERGPQRPDDKRGIEEPDEGNPLPYPVRAPRQRSLSA